MKIAVASAVVLFLFTLPLAAEESNIEPTPEPESSPQPAPQPPPEPLAPDAAPPLDEEQPAAPPQSEAADNAQPNERSPEEPQSPETPSAAPLQTENQPAENDSPPGEPRPIETGPSEPHPTAAQSGAAQTSGNEREASEETAAPSSDDGANTEEAVEEVPFGTVVTASFVGGMGFLPDAPIGAAISLIWDPSWFWPIELEIGGFFGNKAAASGGGVGTLDQYHAGLLVCAPFMIREVPFRACFGAQGGAIWARGSDFATNHSEWRAVVHGVGRLFMLWSPWRRLSIRLGVSIIVPFIRDRFTYTDAAGETRTLFEVDSIGASFDAGLGLRF